MCKLAHALWTHKEKEQKPAEKKAKKLAFPALTTVEPLIKLIL